MQKYFDDEAFVRYLDYLQYFREPEYLRYLQYVTRFCTEYHIDGVLMCPRRWPGPTLRALELLQEESFRKDIINDQVCMSMIDQGWEAAMSGPSQ